MLLLLQSHFVFLLLQSSLASSQKPIGGKIDSSPLS
jgi:hypothetical protein